MNTTLYLILGMIDSLAILTLMFKIFRFDVWGYRREFLVTAGSASVLSYIMRVVLEVPQYDMIAQYILYIIMLRYLMKVRVYEGSLLSSIGYLTFTLVSFIVYTTFLSMNWMGSDEASSNTTLIIYLIQITSESLSFLIAVGLWKLNTGFSSIIMPPHDVYLTTKLSPLRSVTMIGNLIAATVLFLIIHWIIDYQYSFALALPATAFALALLVYLSYKKEFVLEV